MFIDIHMCLIFFYSGGCLILPVYGTIPVWRPGYLCCGSPKIPPGCSMVGRNNKVKIIWLNMQIFSLHELKSRDIGCWFSQLNKIHSTCIFQSYAPLTVTLITALKANFHFNTCELISCTNGAFTCSNDKAYSTFCIVKLVTCTNKMDCRIN